MYYRLVTCAILFCCILHVTSAAKEWTEWTEWTQCSTTCEFGQRERISRLKNEDGSLSKLTRTDHRECIHNVMCPVAGNWTSWSPWSHCSMPCGMGQQTRVRHCVNPRPAYDGPDCAGPKEESQECKNQRCPPIPADFSMELCTDESRIFLCRSAIQCVNKTDVCDRVVHCHDGSDEMSCYRYGHNSAVSTRGVLSAAVTSFLCLAIVLLTH